MPTKKSSKQKSPKCKISTTVSLSKTKPAKTSRINKLKKAITKKTSPKSTKTNKASKPKSRIKEAETLKIWFIPARVSFFLIGAYYLIFAVITFIGIVASVNLIEPYFTLPFQQDIASVFLLEIAAAFALLSSLLLFHAVREPEKYKWFYFFMIIFFLPGNFISNLQKIQMDLPINFQNYLYFDTILVSIFWAISLLSLYAYLKTLKRTN